MEIRILKKQGKSLRAIAKEVGVAVNTVRKCLVVEAPVCYRARPIRAGKFDPFMDYLRRRVEATRQHWIPATVLCREVRERGFVGSDRLSSYLSGATSFSYQYDADGNRLTQLGSGLDTYYRYDGQSNRLLSLTGWVSSRFDYDAEGNIVSTGNYRYAYDAWGRLVALDGRAGAARYRFDALGRRVAKLDPGRDCDGCEEREDDNAQGATVYYAYDRAGRLMGEYNRSGSRYTEYVWLGWRPLAAIRQNGPRELPKLYYVHTDQLGTPRQVSDGLTGSVVWRWEGEPFGTQPPDEDPGRSGRRFVFNLRYPGQYFDAESGLLHNGARDYHPWLGRYVQSDPIGLAGGINTYTYVGGNPVSLRDPSGTNALAGAEFGAEVGSFFGPAGTAIGAIVGLVGGYVIANQLATLINKNPFTGEPGSWSSDGNQDRLYGADGWPAVDIDTGHDHGAGDPHAHNWDRPSDGSPPTHENRGPGVPVCPVQ